MQIRVKTYIAPHPTAIGETAHQKIVDFGPENDVPLSQIIGKKLLDVRKVGTFLVFDFEDDFTGDISAASSTRSPRREIHEDI